MEKTFNISKEEYLAVKAAWITRKNHSAWEHVIYNVLRSKPAKLGFVEKKKNIQGGSGWFAYEMAKTEASQKTMNESVVDNARANMRVSQNRARFVAAFGISLTDAIYDLVRA